MASEKQGITVRFDEGEMQELGSLAERYRVSSATILRWALRALVANKLLYDR
jgi:DNA-binding GntR family transcriptional regulator